MLDEEEKNAALSDKKKRMWVFFFPDTVVCFLFDVSYNSSHLRTSSINFSSIFEDKNTQHSLQADTPSSVEGT